MNYALKSTTLAVVAATCLIGAGADTSQAAGTVSSGEMASSSSAEEVALPANPQSKMPLASMEAFAPDAQVRSPRIRGASGVSLSSESAASQGMATEAAEAFGKARAPYTTVRVAVRSLGTSTTAPMTPVTSYPFRPAGKLWARWGDSWFVCTASLVKPSVLITAAHCIFEYGKKANGWADEVRFIPANYDTGSGPYGTFTARDLRVPTPYYRGRDTCTQRGVVCNNDLATVVLNANASSQYAGNMVGWYAYGWNGYSYTRSKILGSKTVAHITQLGYPQAFDGGYQMQRTDAVGWYLKDGNLKNTQIGSAQTGGSSGGPWLVNLGVKASIDTSEASFGRKSAQAVVGVTSYGWIDKKINRQGASYFGQNKQFSGRDYGGYGAGNIGKIMYDTCRSHSWAC